MCKLWKDQHFFPFFFTLLKQHLNKNHLSTGIQNFIDPVFIGLAISQKILLEFLDEAGVVTALPQLNFQIVEIGVVAGCGSWRETLHQHCFVFLVQSSVNRFLNVCHFDVYDGFLKGRNGLFNIFLHSSEEVGLEKFVQFLYLFLVGQISELSFKCFPRNKFLGMNVIEQRPQFLSIILNGGSSQQ